MLMLRKCFYYPIVGMERKQHSYFLYLFWDQSDLRCVDTFWIMSEWEAR